MRIATISWMFGSAWAAMVSGVQLKSFARLIGFTDFDFGLLAAAPPLATVGMIVAAMWIERTGLRKYQFLHCASIHRLLWLVIAGIPLAMLVPSRMAVYAMLAVYWLSWLMHSFGNPAWTTWMGDMVPKRIRGRYFAARFGFGRLIQVVLVVGTGFLLDYVTVPNGRETADAQPTLLYTICGIFAAAAIIGLAEILMYRNVREIRPPRHEDQDEGRPAYPVYQRREMPPAIGPGRWLAQAMVRMADRMRYVVRSVPAVIGYGVVEPMKDVTFRRYVYFGVTIGFANAVPGFFFWVFTTETLGFSKLATQILFMVIGPILGMFGLKVWGQLLDRWGRRPVLIGATFMTIFSVTPYFFCTRHTPWPAFITEAANWVARVVGPWVGHSAGWVWITPDMPVGAYLLVSVSVMVGGIGWTGVMMGQTNIMLAMADTAGRSRNVAAATALVSIGSVIGAPVGGVLVTFIDNTFGHVGAGNTMIGPTWQVGPFLLCSYHATFALSCLGRIGAMLWLLGMPDPGAGTVGSMVRSVGLIAYGNVSNWFLYPLRVIRRRNR